MTPPIYKLEENIKVKLTKAQQEQLRPLIEKAKKNANTGFVLGQYYGDATSMNFQFVTAEDVLGGIAEALRIRAKKQAAP